MHSRVGQSVGTSTALPRKLQRTTSCRRLRSSLPQAKVPAGRRSVWTTRMVRPAASSGTSPRSSRAYRNPCTVWRGSKGPPGGPGGGAPARRGEKGPGTPGGGGLGGGGGGGPGGGGGGG